MRLDERYVELGLGLGRHVDAYIETLREEIDAAGLEPQRRRWLARLRARVGAGAAGRPG